MAAPSALRDVAHTPSEIHPIPVKKLRSRNGTRLTGVDAALTRDAFDNFLNGASKRLGRRFLAWAEKHGINEADAWDAIQDQLLLLWNKVKSGEATAEILNDCYLLKQTMRRAFHNLRRGRRLISIDANEIDAEDCRECWRTTAHAEQADALAQLSELERAVVVLYDIERYKQTEVAERLEIDQYVVSRIRARAIQKLRSILSDS